VINLSSLRLFFDLWEVKIWAKSLYLGSQIEEGSRVLGPEEGSVLHFGTIEGAQPLKSPNNALKYVKNIVFLTYLSSPDNNFILLGFFSSTQDLWSFVTKKED
jgi:hypothetical protein